MILFLRRRLTDSRKKTFRKQQPKRKKRPVTRMTNPTTRTRKLYDAVVENINGGLAKVAELLGRNEAELATAAVPAGTGDTSEEHEAFDMNDFL